MMREPRASDALEARQADRTDEVVLEDLHKAFGPLKVLDGLDLRVRRGESMVVIGGSGQGKSVLIKHIIGLLAPDSGRVVVDGVDLSTLSSRELTRFRQRFGMAFQEGALFDSMTVAENVGFSLRRLTNLSPAAIRERVDECLSLVRLQGVGEKLPSELSGGQKQRIGIARALAAEPSFIICDEVTSALDQLVAEGILRLLDKLQRDLNLSYMFITHDLATVRSIADEVVVMQNGRVVEQGPKDKMFRPPHHEYTDLLLSSVPEMDPDWLTNLLDERGVDNIGEAALKDMD